MLKWLPLLHSPWRERETRWVVRTLVAWLSFIKAAYTLKEALFCAVCDISTLSWFTTIGQIIWVKKLYICFRYQSDMLDFYAGLIV